MTVLTVSCYCYNYKIQNYILKKYKKKGVTEVGYSD